MHMQHFGAGRNCTRGVQPMRHHGLTPMHACMQARPMIATMAHNPKLCGMIPAGIRYAHGFDPAGTRLGQPCDA